MGDPIASPAARILVWASLILLVLLPSTLGSLASVGAVLLAVIPALALLPTRAGREAVLRQPALALFLAVFIVLLMCFALSARNPGNLLHLAGFLALPSALTLYLAAGRWDVERPALVLAALAALGAVICAVVAANDVFLRGLERAAGFIMGGNLLARIALLLAFLGLAALFATRSRWRHLAWLGPMAALLVIILTGTRGAVLAVPGFLAVLAAVLWADRRDRHLLFVLGGIAFAGLAVFAASGRMAGIIGIAFEVLGSGASATDASTAQRLDMQQAAWQAFLASPWFGHGWANLPAAAAPYLRHPLWQSLGIGADFQFHSDLANLAVAAGIPGILSWLALLVAPVAGALASPRDTLFRVRLYCCLQLSVGYAIFGLTDFSFGYDLPTTLYAFLTAMVLGMPGGKPAVAQPPA